MFRPVHRVPVVAAAGLALIFTLAPAPAARAQCNSGALTPGVASTATAATANVNFSLPSGTYVALGARSAAGTNHSLGAYANSAGSPTCVSGVLATSTTAAPAVEVVIGDYRPGHNPAGVRHGQAVRSSGAGNVTFELETAARILTTGAPPDSVYAAPPVLDLFQSFLEGGTTYTLNFAPTGADLHLLVFTNPGTASYWGGRGTLLANITGPTLFTAPSSEDYALAVVNENGAVGSYALWVEICQAPDTLISSVSEPVVYPFRDFFEVDDPYWQAVGVRSAGGADWNMAVYDTGRGSPEPLCYGGLLNESNRASGVDFVVGDLSSGPVKGYYSRETLASGSGAGLVEWDGGPDEIFVDDTTHVVRSTGPTDVLEAWDVFMDPTQQITIRFQPTGAAALRWFLLSNPAQGPGGAVWKNRDQAVLTGTGYGSYTPTSEGWHALVVVNENGLAGGYSITVTSGAAVDAPGAPPGPSRLGAITPNPLRGHARIGYTLAGPAQVRIDVLDVSGRRVARLDGGDRPAGAGTLAWEGRGDGGERLATGVYFARLFVDGRALGAARMVLVR